MNDLKGRGALDPAAGVARTPERQHFNVRSEGRLFKRRICTEDKPAGQFDEAVFKMHKGVTDATPRAQTVGTRKRRPCAREDAEQTLWNV